MKKKRMICLQTQHVLVYGHLLCLFCLSFSNHTIIQMSDANFLRLPHINSTTLPSGNLQAGVELRAPAPHNQPYYRSGGFTQLLSQPSRQQNATWPSMVSSPSSRGPLVATLQNSHFNWLSHYGTGLGKSSSWSKATRTCTASLVL